MCSGKMAFLTFTPFLGCSLKYFHTKQKTGPWPALCLVREKGLEPSHLAAHAPKACVSTIPPLALVEV